MAARQRRSWLAQQWHRTGPNGRLAVGLIFVLVIWFVGLAPHRIAGIDFAWPYAFLVAAVGWARAGLSVRPMLALVVLGLLQDIAMAAPFGSHVIVALGAYGSYAAAASTLDIDTDPLMSRVMPFISLAFGVFLLWLLASTATGYAVRLRPMLVSGLSTAVLYVLLQSVLDLAPRSGAMSGRS